MAAGRRKAAGSSRKSSSALPKGGRRGSLPAQLSPELATLVDAPPSNPADWLFEIKFDGYRMLARVEGQDVRFVTRNGHDWTDRLPHLRKALVALKLPPCWLDGEIVVPTKEGGTSFQALQNAFDSSRTGDIVYYLFDAPWLAGQDLTRLPLVERRALLEKALAAAKDPIRFSEAFDADPAELVASACRLGLEGIIGKRRDSTYVSRRSPEWIKLKCSHRQEFVIGGWTDPQGSRVGFGALLLGVHDEQGKLVYAGKVGTGFDGARLTALHRKLQALATDEKPFAGKVPEARRAHWVRPKLLAEVTFTEWTQDGHVRHAVFHALRGDKPAKAIVREAPVTPLGPDAEEQTADLPSNLRVTNPDRVVDPSSGLRKIDVLRYYAAAGAVMIEHLAGRPVSLVRAPEGIKGPQIFQKHLERGHMEGIEHLDPALDRDHVALLEVARPVGLLSAAQMNVIEFHTWNAVKSDIDRPDRITFDLDPGEGIGWRTMQEAALLVKDALEKLGLVPFLKTSGGKGLHLVTPLKREHGWDTVKGFSQAVVEHMAATLPQLFVAKSGPKNRVKRIFIDYLRNGFGATTVAAWSVRARPGLGISVPVEWKELPQLTGGAHWHLRNARERIALGNAPWKSYRSKARALGPAMRRLRYEPAD